MGAISQVSIPAAYSHFVGNLASRYRRVQARQWRHLCDGNGNLTRRTTLVSGAPTGAYIQYTRDQRNQLTKIEFYNAPVNCVWPLNKTVSYSYDRSSNRISKTLTVPGQTSVVENYVYDGDQLVAVMDGTGVIQHEYFNSRSMDQVFADQTALSSCGLRSHHTPL